MADLDMRAEWIGKERNPVVIIDDFAPDLQAMRAEARNLNFVPVPDQYYPGSRAEAPSSYFDEVGPKIKAALGEFYGCKHLQVQRILYSLASTLTTELRPEQRLPHYDTLFENYYAAVHFLCPKEFGGTAFFRHRATGFETINAARHAAYAENLETEIAALHDAAPAYPTGDNSAFEHLATIDAHPNRVVLFRGNSFHSGAVSNTLALPSDPMTGRLTVVSFLIAD